jgi:hypothetical protein
MLAICARMPKVSRLAMAGPRIGVPKRAIEKPGLAQLAKLIFQRLSGDGGVGQEVQMLVIQGPANVVLPPGERSLPKPARVGLDRVDASETGQRCGFPGSRAEDTWSRSAATAARQENRSQNNPSAK